jgi:demethylmacrocin O-methyltransferase
MTLDELSVKHDTDKGSMGHWYTPHYEKIFEPIKLNVQSVCEVGVGSGASLKMWRDYFQGATIYGVDMNHNNDMGSRIVLYECEQTDCVGLRDKLQDKKLEIIVEDASHDQEKTMKTLDCLWPILESKGWYVIEDMCIDSFPPDIGRWYGKCPEQIRELHIFKNRGGGSLITFIQKR